MTDRRPAEVFPPGDFIKEEMEERGWTQQDLAEILGKPLPTMNQILKGKKAVVIDTARRLAAAFGTSAQFWLNLETSFRLHSAPANHDVESAVRSRAKLYESAPIREMEKRGWIKKTNTHAALNDELRRFFQADALDKVPAMDVAARASVGGEYEGMSAPQWAWCVRARYVARSVHARPFRRANFADLVSQLKVLMSEAEEIRHVPKILAEVGICFVIVEHLSKTRMDGAALWNESQPVIALSLRYGRLDHFWFTLLHELAHVFYEDGLQADVLLFEPGSSESGEEVEDRANKQAAAWLVDQEKMDSFILRTSPLYSPRKITNFSRRLNVHPSIVLGQLKFKKELDWPQMTRMNVDIREIVRNSAICDGWGQVPPTAE